MAGRPRKPLEMQTRKGTKAEKEERKFQEEHSKVERTFKVPEWLNDRARKKYFEIIELINTIGVLDDLDVPLLAIYCDSYARIEELAELIDKEGYTVIKESKAGIQSIANPNLKTLKDMQKTVLDCAVKLGLNSIDRTKLIKVVPKQEEVDEFKDLL